MSKSLTQPYLDSIRFTGDDLATLRQLGEFRGRQMLFQNQVPEALKSLLRDAVIESTVSSSRIEGVQIGNQRARKIIEQNAQPKNRSEQEVAGYRDALSLIHEAYAEAKNRSEPFDSIMPFSSNIILQLHGTLYRFHAGRGGVWKNQDNIIEEKMPDGKRRVRFRPVSAFETPKNIEVLTQAYRDAISDGRDPLVLIPLVVLDFLCIHPFLDGNGRVARLVTLLLLYHHEYEIGRYVALEKVIESSKQSYYETLETSSQGWHEANHNVAPWLHYFWGTVTAAYKEFEERVEVAARKDQNKEERIRDAVRQFDRPFTISELDSALPDISRDWIRKILRMMRDDGKIESSGVGRSARWKKTVEPRRHGGTEKE